MLLCLMDLCDEEEVGDTHTLHWVNAVDRGGLCRVSEATYMLFYEMESVLRTTYTRENAKNLEDGRKDELVKKVVDNEDVKFQWCIVATESFKASELL